jgi:folate-binding Fe-S cluster repair protein YgfZ
VGSSGHCRDAVYLPSPRLQIAALLLLLLLFLPTADTHEVLLDVDAASTAGVLNWLTRFKLRRAVSLADVSTRYAAWAAWDGDFRAGGAGATTVQSVQI